MAGLKQIEDSNLVVKGALSMVADYIHYDSNVELSGERDQQYNIDSVIANEGRLTGRKMQAEEYLMKEFKPIFPLVKDKLLPTMKFQDHALTVDECSKLKESVPLFLASYGMGLTDGHINSDYARVFLMSLFRLVNVRDVGLMLYNHKMGCYCEIDNILQGFLFKLTSAVTFGDEAWSEMAWSNIEKGLTSNVPSLSLDDMDQRYVPMANVDVDTVTGAVITHSPQHYATISNDITYDKDAKAPRWIQFLNEVIIDDEGNPDVETIEILQLLVGNTLAASHKANVFVYLHGGGANGKSVFLEILSQIMGYANTSAVGLTSLGGSFGKEPLIGKRVNIATENITPKDFNSSDLKSITSGDSIIVNRKGKPALTMRLPIKLWFAANDLVDFGDQSVGLRRRIKAIPFKRKFLLEEQDTNLINELYRELPGILNWAIEGLIRLSEIDYKIGQSKSMKQLTDILLNVRTTEDQFMKTRVEIKLDQKLKKADVYEAYRQFALADGKVPVIAKAFWSELAAFILKQYGTHIDYSKSNGDRFVNGIGLRG
ncbi:DNA primase family protein [Latilactobacillus sakei]|uniref:DNA primase family protein n=1 Tax=Latilactobacillus sakei TaxID=1599 RepID=UPI003F531A7E